MSVRFVISALAVAFGVAVIFAAVTTAKHITATYASAPMRIG